MFLYCSSIQTLRRQPFQGRTSWIRAILTKRNKKGTFHTKRAPSAPPSISASAPDAANTPTRTVGQCKRQEVDNQPNSKSTVAATSLMPSRSSPPPTQDRRAPGSAKRSHAELEHAQKKGTLNARRIFAGTAPSSAVIRSGSYARTALAGVGSPADSTAARRRYGESLRHQQLRQLCEAQSWEMAGEYPDVLSGAKSGGADFSL